MHPALLGKSWRSLEEQRLLASAIDVAVVGYDVPIFVEPLSVSMPGLHATRWSTNEPYTAMKETYAIGRIELGRSEWLGRGKIYESGPGCVLIKRPGDVHRDVARNGPILFQVVTFSAQYIESRIGKVWAHAQFDPGDVRGAPYQRLHDAIARGVERFALEIAVAEAIDALTNVSDVSSEPTRPVRRAIELLRANLARATTLDELAAHADLDKFHLCRAFRAQVGMAPHAYLTHLRILRAKELLAAGVRPGHVAAQVGLYDQSSLNRHFQRIVGTTPARYARAGSRRGQV